MQHVRRILVCPFHHAVDDLLANRHAEHLRLTNAKGLQACYKGIGKAINPIGRLLTSRDRFT